MAAVRALSFAAGVFGAGGLFITNAARQYARTPHAKVAWGTRAPKERKPRPRFRRRTWGARETPASEGGRYKDVSLRPATDIVGNVGAVKHYGRLFRLDERRRS